MLKNQSCKHIIVGMSGGVDSSVAAYLLKKAGHHVEGVFMKNWEGDDQDDYCPAAKDLADARAVCEKLNIEFHHINFSDDYWNQVFTYFLDEYRAGRTPNPDILCNREIKFKAFLNYALNRGADGIATGHYVRSQTTPQHTLLLKGLDHAKDQSYFLHALAEDQLRRSYFPLGEMTKPEVRKLASELNFQNHQKKDSTGICFIGERKFKEFLNDYLPASPGCIKTESGETIGSHDGLMFYTIGQRQGLNIGGQKNMPESAWYVAKKDLKHNVLYVVQGNDHPALFRRQLKVSQLHWINTSPAQGEKLFAKTRYRQADQACIFEPSENGNAEVIFDEPQRAITPGQSVVFYRGDVCLGGGIIEDNE